MYQVPATRSSVVRFVMTCPGMSHSSTFTLHMRDNGEVDDGKVWGDLCREKRVHIAYNNDEYSFLLDDDTGEMLVTATEPPTYDPMTEREKLGSFFENYDIIPFWINCNYTWGSYDEDLGKWTGAVGKVKETINYIKLHCWSNT